MKKILLIAALCAVSFGSYAGGSSADASKSGAAQQQQQTVTSTGTANASVASGAVAVTFTSPADTSSTATVNQTVSGGTNSTMDERISGTQVVKNVPSVNAPPLTSSNDTCMGSGSAGGAIAGFGITFGKTYVDENCKMLKNSREFWNMGMRAASLALMCNDALNKDALEMTGYECPQTRREREKREGVKPVVVTPAGQALVITPEPTTSNSEPTDPIVRRRMGLPPIKE